MPASMPMSEENIVLFPQALFLEDWSEGQKACITFCKAAACNVVVLCRAPEPPLLVLGGVSFRKPRGTDSH